MSIWKVAVTVLAATAGVVMALLLAGWSQGLALLAYVLFLAAVTLMVLIGQLRAALPPTPRFERLPGVAPEQVEPVGQLETIRRRLAAAGWSAGELHYRLAPMVREVAAARLSAALSAGQHDPRYRPHGQAGSYWRRCELHPVL